ncbi:MAG: class I SAM-dependent methyltransferase [Planctomycetes bacterium]|nr:class I SAM-dependent methyltransferase [Planctomycetota bacterium]
MIEFAARTSMSDHAQQPSQESNLVYHEAQDRMALLPNYYAWIANLFADHVSGTVLELGSGAGLVVRNYLDRVERVIAVDINRELLARLERTLPREKVTGLEVDLRGDWHELDGVTADCVIALDVVEHFEDDANFVAKMKSRLRPGGKLIVKVPAQTKLYSDMDRASGHFRRYDDADLRALMESHGLRTLALRHMNPAGAWGYRFKKEQKTNFSKTFSPGKLKAVNTLIPMIALLDHVPFLKGLSLVGVFQNTEPARTPTRSGSDIEPNP